MKENKQNSKRWNWEKFAKSRSREWEKKLPVNLQTSLRRANTHTQTHKKNNNKQTTTLSRPFSLYQQVHCECVIDSTFWFTVVFHLSLRQISPYFVARASSNVFAEVQIPACTWCYMSLSVLWYGSWKCCYQLLFIVNSTFCILISSLVNGFKVVCIFSSSFIIVFPLFLF